MELQQKTASADTDTMEREIDAFFKLCKRFVVVGANAERAKFGNKCFRALAERYGQANVFPVNPKGVLVEGVQAFETVDAALEAVGDDKTVVGASLITNSKITGPAVEKLVDAGVTHIWTQPGAENDAAVKYAESKGVGIIGGGPCVLKRLGIKDPHSY